MVLRAANQNNLIAGGNHTTLYWIGAKDPLSGGKTLQEYLHLKRERGEFCIHPAIAPVSLMSAETRFVVKPTQVRTSGGQNLAALCTTAGQNLAAVGSSHSLTETVNLGTMTTAGLVGTLHNTYTSYIYLFICSTVK